MILPSIETPADLKGLNEEQLAELCEEIRTFIVETVTTTGGHLGSNLGAVELTVALHRVFDSPRDVILWDTGHQAYVHKLLTGRRYGFKTLKQAGGMSGYPNRAESEHDWIENSHASTGLSYAHGIASGFELRGIDGERKVVAVVGDGALDRRHGLRGPEQPGPFEATRGDRAQRQRPLLRADGLPALPEPDDPAAQSHLHRRPRTPAPAPARAAGAGRAGVFGRALGDQRAARHGGAAHLLRSAGRALCRPHRRPRRRTHGTGLHARRRVGRPHRRPRAHPEGPRLRPRRRGRRPTPPRREGHQVPSRSRTRWATRRDVRSAAPPRPTVAASPPSGSGPESSDRRVPAAAPPPTPMPSHARCWPRRKRTRAWWRSPPPCPARPACWPSRPAFPDRFFDVGIAEQHGATSAAGMAMAGLRPVVAVYSTFWSRSFDQANLDVGLHGCPVVFVLDRAGITGDDGPSHHGDPRPGPGALHPRHDGVRAVVGRGGRADVAHRPGAAGPLDHPRAQDRATARRPRRGGERAAGAPAARRRRVSSASSASARRSGPASRPPTSSPPRGSSPPCGTRG